MNSEKITKERNSEKTTERSNDTPNATDEIWMKLRDATSGNTKATERQYDYEFPKR